MKCAIEGCNDPRYVNGEISPFCRTHQVIYRQSEGKHPRPSGPSDFRDRLWKERFAAEFDRKAEELRAKPEGST